MTTESGELLPAAPASTAALVNALTALRTTATQIHFTLPVPGAEQADERAHRAGPPARRPSAPPAAPVGRAAAHRGRRIDRRGQVDRGQQPGPGAGQPGRGAAPDHPLPGAGVPPLRPALVLRRPGAARAGPDQRCGRRSADAAAGQLGGHGPGPGLPGRPGHRLGGRGEPPSWPASCWPRPICGCSSPRPRDTPTRCRGSCCRPPRPAAPRWPCCWTGCRRGPSRRWARTCGRCCGRTGSARPRCS